MIASEEIFKAFELLNGSVEYVMIKNIANELPNNLREGKDIDIIVHPNSFKKYRYIILHNGFIQIIHPFGTLTGWKFLDKYAKVSKYVCIYNGIYFDVCHGLSCKTLSNNCWISLPSCFQDRVWRYKYWDKNLKCWRMDEITLLAYLFVRSVFDWHKFSPEYINEIEMRKDMFDDFNFRTLLNSVFTNYDQKLIQLAKIGKYDSIINEFYAFAGDKNC